jgi:hypothetical protein
MPAAMPNEALVDALLPAYRPCVHFQEWGGTCREAKWLPAQGHMPRGFLGATGDLGEVEVVLVFAEPGHPYEDTRFEVRADPRETIRDVVSDGYAHKSFGRDLFHRNIRRFLNRLYPGMTFDQQLRRAWLTEGRLCSIENEIGNARDNTCSQHYLRRQLDLLRRATIIAFGGKAQRYLRALGVPFVSAYALAPPGCNHRPAASSWEAAAAMVEKRRG